MFELSKWMYELNDCEFKLQDRMLKLKVWIEQQVWIMKGLDTFGTQDGRRDVILCHVYLKWVVTRMDTPKYGETLKFISIKYQTILAVLPKDYQV